MMSGDKWDAGESEVPADLARTDSGNRQALPGTSEEDDAIEDLASLHQSLLSSRQRQVNQLRDTLQDFYPSALEAFGEDLGGKDALAILEYAPTPVRARSVSRAKLVSALRKAGREGNLEQRAVQLQAILRRPQLEQEPDPPSLEDTFGFIVGSCIRLIRQLDRQLSLLEQELEQS